MKELDVQGFCAEPKTTTLTLSLKETRIPHEQLYKKQKKKQFCDLMSPAPRTGKPLQLSI